MNRSELKVIFTPDSFRSLTSDRQIQKFFLPRDEFNKKMKKNDEEYDEEGDEEGDEEEEEDEEEDGRR